MGTTISTERVKAILDVLDETYGTEYICYLNHTEPYELLIAVILSAQCTDERVNMVTKDLFVKYPTLDAFASASASELEKDIYSIGFHRAKSKNIVNCCKKLISEYDGRVPDNMDELLTLDGVGRKTANVILGNVYHIPSIVVDTHVLRISKRLGLTTESDPVKVEKDLMRVLPEEHWILYNIQIITFGRNICYARKPKCDECPLRELCKQGVNYENILNQTRTDGIKQAEADAGTDRRTP